ncbi:MAG: hypothetical protein IPI59_07200 [Sphingobacteriales bacterium]|nr:hypothetical protein [Sphingobacteriales bacterium]MBP9141396.1 hypothetical protein [Chitinophagales bacterium]MDA0198111.1 hypothetical protein [Bacteroidota bacterium]MBK6890149.1 hypothetical protein [Sphingobacteriales bacterium]MBK7527325.1 hypothetical protein [Sphingobacteriales bacterium]
MSPPFQHQQRSYPAKLLLFGEYSIIYNGFGLAVPYKQFWGKWHDEAILPHYSNNQLHDFCAKLPGLQTELSKLGCELRLNAFKNALRAGLIFDSNIPNGYGMGSSGAVVAAFYERFCRNITPSEKNANNTDANSYANIRKSLAIIEGIYHYNSSGLDPFISHMQQPVLLKNQENLELLPESITNNLSALRFFLFDTGVRRFTGQLVEATRYKIENNPEVKAILLNQISLHAQQAAAAFIAKDKTTLEQNFEKISALQLANFPELVPEKWHALWQQGLDSKQFYLKLCGAGGGGFLLGIALYDFEKIPSILQPYLSQITWA